jgi:membrane-associated phospholipid phosphatase
MAFLLMGEVLNKTPAYHNYCIKTQLLYKFTVVCSAAGFVFRHRSIAECKCGMLAAAHQSRIWKESMPSPHLSRLRKFVEARLSPAGEFGLHLTCGVILLFLAVALFAAIADEVVETEQLVALDVQVANWFHSHATGGVTRFMLLVTHIHSVAGTCVLSALLGAWFYRRNAVYWLLALATAVPGGMLLNVLLKYAFTRARPVFDQPLLTLTTYSFPSGHTSAAALFYGIVAAYLICLTRAWRQRAAIALGASIMVFLVGLSRVYLGAHFLSDVLAAAVESCGWLAVCITAVSTIRRRRAARADQ